MGLPYEFTQDILDSIAEGIYTVNKDFRINSFNRAAEKITGYKRDEVLGKFCKNVLSSDRCVKDCPIARVLENGENLQDVENTLITRNGKEVPIKMNAAVFRNAKSSPIGGVVSFRDMSYLENVQNSLIKQSQFHGIIGQSKVMREIYTLIREIAETNSSVMLGGESGTGKELIANAIQAESTRAVQFFLLSSYQVNYSDMYAAHLPMQDLTGLDGLRWRMAVLFFWMKLLKYLCRCNYNCFVSCRKEPLNG